MGRAAVQPDLFAAETPSLPDGMVYREAFLSPSEEAALVERFERLAFGEVRMHGVVARRRIIQFGWHYGFDSRSLEKGAALPPFLCELRNRVASLMNESPERLAEVLVTEYRPGATIGWHRDAPAFESVAGVSLAAPCRFRLRRQVGDGWERRELLLEPRSAYVIQGEARTSWQHSIPPVDRTRYSVTFRTLRRRRMIEG